MSEGLTKQDIPVIVSLIMILVFSYFFTYLFSQIPYAALQIVLTTVGYFFSVWITVKCIFAFNKYLETGGEALFDQ